MGDDQERHSSHWPADLVDGQHEFGIIETILIDFFKLNSMKWITF